MSVTGYATWQVTRGGYRGRQELEVQGFNPGVFHPYHLGGTLAVTREIGGTLAFWREFWKPSGNRGLEFGPKPKGPSVARLSHVTEK